MQTFYFFYLAEVQECTYSSLVLQKLVRYFMINLFDFFDLQNLGHKLTTVQQSMNHFVGQQTLFSQKFTQTKLAAINGMTVGIQFSLAHADIQSRSVNEAPPRPVEEMKHRNEANLW